MQSDYGFQHNTHSTHVASIISEKIYHVGRSDKVNSEEKSHLQPKHLSEPPSRWPPDQVHLGSTVLGLCRNKLCES